MQASRPQVRGSSTLLLPAAELPGLLLELELLPELELELLELELELLLELLELLLELELPELELLALLCRRPQTKQCSVMACSA